MYSLKQLFEYSQTLKVLYVEDDDVFRVDMKNLLTPLFKQVDLAVDGEDGLAHYNKSIYDMVITDINMPKMNGIEMIKHIREISPEQKVVAVSAHNDGAILIKLIKAGIQSFILKPALQDDIINTLYPISRDAYTKNKYHSLLTKLAEEKKLLLEKNRTLEAKTHTIDTKHRQLESLLERSTCRSIDSLALSEQTSNYFKADTDEAEENILLLSDHCDDIHEIFEEIPLIISGTNSETTVQGARHICDLLQKASTIFIYYTPYMDTIAHSFNDLRQAIEKDLEQFTALVKANTNEFLSLFDAVSSDMERYIVRFSVESVAMKNIHHIHQPTALSIQQIIVLIDPSECEFGELEFF